MAVEYDVVILGGGTGGYVAAIRAAQLGLKTVIVEQKKLGGTCLHEGCIPTKALIKSAEIYDQLKNASRYGIYAQQLSFSLEDALLRKNNIVEQLHKGIQKLIQKGAIDVYYGTGRILGPSIFSPLSGTISVELESSETNEMLVPKNLIIATGAHSRALSTLPFDGKYILDSTMALQLKTLPKRIIIVGGGVIGIEWASILCSFDVEVTIIETAEHILPQQDITIAKHMEKRLRAKGIRVLTKAIVNENSCEIENGVKIQAHINGQIEILEADCILVAIGRVGNIHGIGLENTDIEVDGQFIKVNEHFQTNEKHIYAIGDCIGGMQLAHVAMHEGIRAVEHIARLQVEPIQYKQVATCIYSEPQIASIGLTEQQAIMDGLEVITSRLPLQAVGKAHIEGDMDGFVKIVANKLNDDVIGVHIIGPHATELITQSALALTLNASVWELGQVIYPHPTIGEALGEAALAIHGKGLHF